LGFDTESHEKEKKGKEIDIPGLDEVHGQPGATIAQLKVTTDSFFLTNSRGAVRQ